MTGDEIVALARGNFGEPDPLMVTADTAEDFLNSALRELFNDLPVERMKNRLTESTVTMTSNKGPVENTWDRVVEVYVDDKPALMVSKDVIQNADHNSLFSPPIAIFHIDNSHVWVSPSGAVKVVHLTPPDDISSMGSEVTEFPDLWHPALALLISSYMYAQEEDITQAGHYRNEYAQMISNLISQTTPEEEAA